MTIRLERPFYQTIFCYLTMILALVSLAPSRATALSETQPHVLRQHAQIELHDDGFSYHLDRQHRVRLTFRNSPTPRRIEHCTMRTAQNITTNFQIKKNAICYRHFYRSTDLLIYHNGQDIEYDFLVQPGGAAVKQIQFTVDANHLQLDQNGDLLIFVGELILVQKKPHAYQIIDRQYHRVPARYDIAMDKTIGIKIGHYNRKHPLIIDPILSWTKLLDGSGQDLIKAMVIDDQGNIYIGGDTNSQDFPITADALQPQLYIEKNNSGIFITKIDASTKEIIYSTFLDGSKQDRLQAMALDPEGNLYITGHTLSDDFIAAPLPGVFVSKLAQDGTRFLFSRTIAPLSALSHDIAVNTQGEAIITGIAYREITLVGALDNQREATNSKEGFVVKLNPNGSTLFSTYLGGNKNDVPTAVALDKQGQVYVTGFTESADFPLKNAMQSQFGGAQDVFVSKLDANGSRLIYSTYIGGKELDQANDIAVDDAGRVFIVGHSSVGFPTVNTLQTDSLQKGIDVIVAVLDAQGKTLLFSSYLGGAQTDIGKSIDLTSRGEILLSGVTYSMNFPRLSPVQPDLGGASDAFFLKLTPPGYEIEYSSFLGGQKRDAARQIVVGQNDSVYIAGLSLSNDFPGNNESASTQKMFTFISKIVPLDVTADVEAMFIKNDQQNADQSALRKIDLLVANNGVNNATFVKLELKLPKKITVVSKSTPGFSCFKSQANQYLCVNNGLAAGDDLQLSFELDLGDLQTAKISVESFANELDPNGTNNFDQIMLRVAAAAPEKPLPAKQPKANNPEPITAAGYCYSYP